MNVFFDRKKNGVNEDMQSSCERKGRMLGTGRSGTWGGEIEGVSPQ